MNIQEYSVTLFTSFEKNKTTSVVAEEMGIRQSSARRFIKSISIQSSDFVQYAHGLFGEKPVNLVNEQKDKNLPEAKGAFKAPSYS